MVEDRFVNLLSKASIKIQVDRLPWEEDQLVVFRRKVENLPLVIDVNSCNAIRNVTSKHV